MYFCCPIVQSWTHTMKVVGIQKRNKRHNSLKRRDIVEEDDQNLLLQVHFLYKTSIWKTIEKVGKGEEIKVYNYRLWDGWKKHGSGSHRKRTKNSQLGKEAAARREHRAEKKKLSQETMFAQKRSIIVASSSVLFLDLGSLPKSILTSRAINWIVMTTFNS